MNDESQRPASPLDKITGKIEEHMREALLPSHIVRERDYPKFPGDSVVQLKHVQDEPPPYSPKNEDVPRAGELSSKVFNDLTTRIISELQEAVESLITDASNRRSHVAIEADSFKAEVDKLFADFEANAKRHQEKVNALADAVRKKVAAETQEMIALSNRLRDFADSVNNAHEKFFKE